MCGRQTMNKWCNITQDIFCAITHQKPSRKSPCKTFTQHTVCYETWAPVRSIILVDPVVMLCCSCSDKTFDLQSWLSQPGESYRSSLKEMPYPGLKDIREMVWEDIKLANIHCKYVKVQLPTGVHHFTLTFIYMAEVFIQWLASQGNPSTKTFTELTAGSRKN